jgi:LPXTG-motif cell wall-anchored protein
MQAKLPVLSPDVYKVRWQTLSADDDDYAQGSYSLTVLNPDGSSPGAAQEATKNDGGGGSGGTALVAGGVVVALIVGASAFYFSRRRKA